MASHSPPFDRTASSSSRRRTLQTTPQDSSHRAVISPLEGRSWSAGQDETERAGPYDMPQATIQNPVSEQHGGQSSGPVSRRPSRRSTASFEPSSTMPIDPQPFDFSELQRGQAHTQVYGYPGGAGRSRTDPQSTLGDGNALRREVCSGKDSRESSVCDNDVGRSQPGVLRNDLEASRMLPVPILTHPVLGPVGGPVLGVADATQEGYPDRSSRNHFCASFHFILRSRHSCLSRNYRHHQKAILWPRELPTIPHLGGYLVLTVRSSTFLLRLSETDRSSRQRVACE